MLIPLTKGESMLRMAEGRLGYCISEFGYLINRSADENTVLGKLFGESHFCTGAGVSGKIASDPCCWC